MNHLAAYGVDSSGGRVIKDVSATTVRAHLNVPTRTGGDASGTWSINISGNAATATKLQTSRTIRTNLASTSTASFDGSANITPGVTGTLGVANGGTGVTSWTTNRLIYASGATTLTTSSHYISSSTVCINGTNTDYTFYVNGNSFCNGTITFNSDSHGLRTLRNNYTNIGADGTAFFWGYINNIKGTGSCTYSSFNATSDARLKTNFKSVSFGDIFDLPIYKFDFIDGEKDKIGCLAQDLQQICPEIVHQGEDGYLSIEESKIVYLLLDKMKEMQREIDTLKEAHKNG
jgi:hypothetical protein